MAVDQGEDSILIDTTAPEILEATLDVQSYPAWARSIRQVTVRERDGEGRPLVVSYVASALGFRIRYTLRYDFSGLPSSYRWMLVEGDARVLEGEYIFDPDGEGRTKVTYRLSVELSFPLPRFVLRRAERLVMSLALKELKAYVES